MNLSSPLSTDYAGRFQNASLEVMSVDGKLFRLRFILTFVLLWTAVILLRLYTLQVAQSSVWQSSALRQHVTTVELASERGPILDRNGKLLAVSVPAGSVYVRPKQVQDKTHTARLLAEILSLEEELVQQKLEEIAPFVWIKRQVPKVYAEQIQTLAIKGVGYLPEARRFYPNNHAASTLIGKVGVDGNGLSGIEARFERYLEGEPLLAQVARDGFGKEIEIPLQHVSSRQLPKGQPLSLTLDTGLQVIMEQELEEGRLQANAKRAMSAMIDAESGEILAMAHVPSINFNQDQIRSRQQLKNTVLETIFEPGSIMKPVVAAIALEQGVVNPEQVVDCEGGAYPFGKHTINDVHPEEQIPFHDVVVRSSNIGMTKIGMELGKDRLYLGLRSFGFGKGTRLGLPGETAGILRKPGDWAAVDVATHSFGQGVAVTPLQVVRAISAITNGGLLPELKIVKDGQLPRLHRIISAKTAERVREMMYGVVEDEHGTGSRAKISGVRIGGKTGTAQRVRDDGRGYEPGSYVSSFIGFADGTALGVKKKLALIVVIDRPDTDSIYGGTLAAPVFQRIMHRTMHSLSMVGGAVTRRADSGISGSRSA